MMEILAQGLPGGFIDFRTDEETSGFALSTAGRYRLFKVEIYIRPNLLSSYSSSRLMTI